MFPIAGTASVVLAARVIDRLGKGIRDAPRDAYLADLTAKEIRGEGFGFRLALAISGFVLGPLIAIGLMTLSGDDFRLVFWIALIPAYLSIVVLLVAVKELPSHHDESQPWYPIRRSDFTVLPAAFWWVAAIATLLSLARFSQAFLVLKANDIGVDSAFVPMVLVVMHLVFSVAAYPFGILADHLDRRLQLGIGDGYLVRRRCGIGQCEHRLADGAGGRPLGLAARCNAGTAGSYHRRCSARSHAWRCIWDL
jgi:MFS family permease